MGKLKQVNRFVLLKRFCRCLSAMACGISCLKPLSPNVTKVFQNSLSESIFTNTSWYAFCEVINKNLECSKQFLYK